MQEAVVLEQEEVVLESEPERAQETRNRKVRIAACVAMAVGAGATLLPALLMTAGVFLVITVGVHLWVPSLRPYSNKILHVPVALARRRHTHLAIAAGVGALLIACGAGGASLRAQVLSERAQQEQDRAAAAEKVDALLVAAQQRLDSGDAGGAEFVLMNAEGIESERQSEVDELLDRMRRSSDSEAILELLVGMDAEDYAAVESGSSLPEALDFGEQALTYQAVELAVGQLDEARYRRARR